MLERRALRRSMDVQSGRDLRLRRKMARIVEDEKWKME
jgi:hypothetical protein